jgi:hypothetical protein
MLIFGVKFSMSGVAEFGALFCKFNVLIKLSTSGISLAPYPTTKPFPSPFFPPSRHPPDFESTLAHQSPGTVRPSPP